MKELERVINILNKKPSKVPLLDCYLLKNGQVLSYFTSNKQGEYMLLEESIPQEEVLFKIYREVLILQKLGLTSKLACFFLIRDQQHRISVQDLDIMIATGSIPSEIDLIQVLKPCLKDGKLAYALTCEFSSRGICPVLFQIKKQRRVKMNDSAMIKPIFDIVDELINTLETDLQRTITYIDFEFIKDDHGQLWLSNINQLQISESLNRNMTLKCFKTMKNKPSLKKNKSHLRNLTMGNEIKHSTPRKVKIVNISLSRSHLETSTKRKKNKTAKLVLESKSSSDKVNTLYKKLYK